MPNGATSGVSDSIQPSTRELRRGVGGGELLADDAGGRGDRHDEPGALGAHDRQHGAGDVQRAEQVGLDLGAEVLGADLLEEPGVEVAGVVDQHVDPAEPVDGGLHGRLGVGRVVTSSVTASRSSCAPIAGATRSGSRPVATTACPAARAARAMSTPMPRPAPVTSQTFFSSCSVLLGAMSPRGATGASAGGTRRSPCWRVYRQSTPRPPVRHLA